MEALKTACAQCGANSIYRCGKCKTAYYCSTEHQKADWKEHRKNCTKQDNSQFIRSMTTAGMLDTVYVGSDTISSDDTALAYHYMLNLISPELTRLRSKIEEIHSEGKRCFVHAEIMNAMPNGVRISNVPIPIANFPFIMAPGMPTVVTSDRVHEFAKEFQSKKLPGYVENYNPDEQISCIINCREPDVLFVVLIIQPWKTADYMRGKIVTK